MKTEAVKKSGFFSAWDIVVYAVLAAVIAVLFLAVAFGGRKSAAGIEITVEGERVYTYLYSKGGEIAAGKGEIVKEKREGEFVSVTVYTGGEGYNEIVIDPGEQKAYVRDANCSYQRDCTYMAAITSESGVIVCVPHALTVRAIGGSEDFSPSVGKIIYYFICG